MWRKRLIQPTAAVSNETSIVAGMVARTPETINELHKMSKQQLEEYKAQSAALDCGMGKLEAKVDELASDASTESAVIRQAVDSIQTGVANLYQVIMVIKKLIAL